MAKEPSSAVKLEIYRRMLRIRHFEQAVAGLAAAGEVVGAIHLSIGQEGAVVGACMALRTDDYIVGTHRSHGHPLGKGADPKPLMAELLGRRTGINKGKGGSMHLADFKVGSLGETSIVGSGLPIAVGAALSSKLRATGQVALAFFGDGATNEGIFHESLNLASIWKLPVVFYCENNLYAVTTRYSDATLVPNVADRVGAYAMAGVIVDGQDPIACWQAVDHAARQARDGGGPSLIEAKTYRYHDHSEGRHIESRTDEEIGSWTARDPIDLFNLRLLREGVASETLGTIEAEVTEQIQDCLDFARSSPFPEPAELFEDLFATPIPPGGL